MGSSPNAGSQVPFAQFIFNSDVFGRKLTEAEEREWVDAEARRLTKVFEAVTASGRTVEVAIFRSRGVRGEEREAPLPSGDLWGIQLFQREVCVFDSTG